MVTFRYDAGEEGPVEIEPIDNEFEYVTNGGYWEVKAGEHEENDVVKWIPSERIYEIEGLRSRIQAKRP